ncbi:hypothetical protein BDN71DRAFT_1498161 [Pleurotus eryngii]|uniref:F-box domain-containing protein n=1 Tax=Pleurotus eryngii TaxID=5323 RepID=A0A9P5ZPM4_PLEER|nr:hypothetical protein BDN71DRAFT_1498161 [Pleurotus eryngii]
MRPPITRTRCSVATKRVMASVELVRYICEHSCRAQNYRNALISKTWSNEALSVMWYKLDTILPLLKLLGPMTLYEENSLHNFAYVRHIQPDNWVVFRRYSWRVHEIHHRVLNYDFSDSIFIDIMATSTLSSYDLMPNLRTLAYDGRGPFLKFVPLLIHKALHSLELHLMNENNFDDDELELLFKRTLSYIPHKSPNLRCLSLSSYSQIPIHTELDAVLEMLPRLKELSITPTLLTVSTLDILAHLPALESWTVYGDPASLETIPNFAVLPSTDAFPSLNTFTSGSLKFSTIISLLKAKKPRNLRRLNVGAPHEVSRNQCYRLIATITSTCPSIEKIHLKGHYRLPWTDDDPDQPMIPAFLSPTHRCSSLISLHLRYSPRLCLTIETMRGLLLGLPSLETLKLDECHAPPTLPLSALSELAPLCPHLKLLTLYGHQTTLYFGPTK